MNTEFPLSRRLAAETLGTAMLVATVVGSGIMGAKLTAYTGLALLGNTLATGAILVVLITVLGPISGAHFNPVVSLVFALRRQAASTLADTCLRPGADGRWYRRHTPSACDVRSAFVAGVYHDTYGNRAVAGRSHGHLRTGVHHLKPGCASGRRPLPGWLASTSLPPTGSPRPPRSPIRQLPSRVR